MKAEELTVSIRPGVKILSVLSHLNYKPWFAIAEFVDNSIQSFLTNRSTIEAVEGPNCKLRVEIELDSSGGSRLIVRDNAAGIHEKDYARAFRPAAAPCRSNRLIRVRNGYEKRRVLVFSQMDSTYFGSR
jgi:hypothetical protein